MRVIRVPMACGRPPSGRGGGGGTRLASAAVRCGASTPPKEVARVGSRPFPSAHSGLHRRAWYCPGLSGICTLCVLGQDSGPVAEFGPLGVPGMPTPTEVLLVLCTQYGTGRNGRCHSRRAPFFTIPGLTSNLPGLLADCLPTLPYLINCRLVTDTIQCVDCLARCLHSCPDPWSSSPRAKGKPGKAKAPCA